MLSNLLQFKLGNFKSLLFKKFHRFEISPLKFLVLSSFI